MSAYDQLVRACDDLDLTVQRYGDETVKAASSEADHKRLRATRILRAKADGTSAVSLCEAIADADSAVADAYLRRLTTAAVADASKQRIASIRERIGALRSYLADQRAADQIQATSGVRP